MRREGKLRDVPVDRVVGIQESQLVQKLLTRDVDREPADLGAHAGLDRRPLLVADVDGGGGIVSHQYRHQSGSDPVPRLQIGDSPSDLSPHIRGDPHTVNQLSRHGFLSCTVSAASGRACW